MSNKEDTECAKQKRQQNENVSEFNKGVQFPLNTCISENMNSWYTHICNPIKCNFNQIFKNNSWLSWVIMIHWSNEIQ